MTHKQAHTVLGEVRLLPALKYTDMTERELLNRIAELEQQLAEANALIDELIDLRPEN